MREITGSIIAGVMRVHGTLGPGFLESVYRRAMMIELCRRGLAVEAEKEVFINYEGHEVGRHRLDFLIERQVILEVKTVEQLNRAHYAQVRSYLRAAAVPCALLVNFSGYRADFRRIEGRASGNRLETGK